MKAEERSSIIPICFHYCCNSYTFWGYFHSPGIQDCKRSKRKMQKRSVTSVYYSQLLLYQESFIIVKLSLLRCRIQQRIHEPLKFKHYD